LPSAATSSNRYKGCRTIRYGPVVTSFLASAIRLNERPRCARAMIDMAVPTELIELATIDWVIERFARGKRVIRAREKVPTIAITLGPIRFAFSTGSSLKRNKTVISARKQTVEERDTLSTRNFQDAGSFCC